MIATKMKNPNKVSAVACKQTFTVNSLDLSFAKIYSLKSKVNQTILNQRPISLNSEATNISTWIINRKGFH